MSSMTIASRQITMTTHYRLTIHHFRELKFIIVFGASVAFIMLSSLPQLVWLHHSGYIQRLPNHGLVSCYWQLSKHIRTLLQPFVMCAKSSGKGIIRSKLECSSSTPDFLMYDNQLLMRFQFSNPTIDIFFNHKQNHRKFAGCCSLQKSHWYASISLA